MKKMSDFGSCGYLNSRLLMRLAGVLMVVAALSACVSKPPAPGLVGHWRGELQGFPVLVSYTENTVTVEGSEPVSYQLNGDVVTLREAEAGSYRIEFPGPGMMVQVDESTGARQSFTRIE